MILSLISFGNDFKRAICCNQLSMLQQRFNTSLIDSYGQIQSALFAGSFDILLNLDDISNIDFNKI